MISAKELKNSFFDIYGAGGETRLFFAPGRVNLIGEHIDYNGGYVFPCAIDLGTYAVVRKREDQKLLGFSYNFKEQGIVEADLDNTVFEAKRGWMNYIVGVFDTFKKLGVDFPHGFELYIRGDIPNGAGLSSSASIEVLTAYVLNAYFNLGYTKVQLAQLCQRSENEYNGVKCGIMDQFAVAMGKKDHAMLLDCNSLEYRYIPFRLENKSLVIINSNKQRSLTDSKYNERRAACERALSVLKNYKEIKHLCQLTEADFQDLSEHLQEPEEIKRARHAVTENQRVKNAVEALQGSDFTRLARLMQESHLSLKDDYEVSVPELDTLAELTWDFEGTWGGRMTGAGFGGCTVNIVENTKLQEFIAHVSAQYQAATGLKADFYVTGVAEGVHEIREQESYIEKLIAYGKGKGFFEETDTRFVRNQILEILSYDDYKEISPEEYPEESLDEVLDVILKWAAHRGIIAENTTLYRDLLDSALLGAMLPRPSEVIGEFWRRYQQSPETATGYLYDLSIDVNYIRKSRTDKNMKWKHPSEYGDIEITINVSKPEKDVREIEAERNAPKTNYPKCLLCAENEGYSGRFNHPARQNLRIIPMTLGGENWFLQYSPYLYYNEHCILLNEEHIPMKIDRRTLEKMLDFLDQLPHYFVGSNADLPIVGGSILSHDHFQGGRHPFPMEGAQEIRSFEIPGDAATTASILKWPLSVIRLKSADKQRLVELGTQILNHWRSYKDEGAQILPYTGTEPHNTITPIARMKNGVYELDLVLRNNRRDEEYPLGIFHPHQEVHNVKKENIGLIEVMGLAVLAARLLTEMKLIEKQLLKKPLTEDEWQLIEKHKDLCQELLVTHQSIGQDNASELIKQAVAEKFILALKHAGVFKEDECGKRGFLRFIQSLGWSEIL